MADTDTISITRSVDIAAPRAAVWAALTTADGLASWFPQRATMDLRIGGGGVMTFEGHGDYAFEIAELSEPDVVAFVWASAELPDINEGGTLARFTLSDIPGGTRVTVVESGFEKLPDPDAAARGNEEGWEEELGELRELLEGASA